MHFLLLWPAVLPQNGSGAAAPLVVRLQADPAPALAPAETAPVRTRRRPPVVVTQAPAAAGLPSSLPDITPDLTVEKPLRSGGGPLHAESIEARAAPAAFASSASGIDADGVRQYRVALAREARRYKRYPPRALEAGIAGTAEVRVSVGTGGFAEDVQLGRSSGNATLDEAALEMMRQAAPRTAVPEPLRRQAFVVSLPVVFDLAGD